jgi:dienelactone hydrolase
MAVIPILLALSLRSASGDEPLAQALRTLDTNVVPAAEREAFASQVRDQQQQRLRNANDRSTDEWRQIKTREDWERFRKKKLDALRASLGAWPEPPPSVPVRVASTVNGDGFVIENILFESRPGWWVSANRYRPTQPRESMPGLLICHAHHTPKEHGELQDMGMTWARAGCVVLVMDQVGHGERRQHPFATAADFDKPYRVGHADYYFRYDSAVQLSLVGESLVGWMAWDMMRGADVLLAQPGVDPKRLILLGAVAGGGDPAAVTGALDGRFAAVVPFNFGGPQPETRHPLPDDAERSFNYAGGGSWESTRNLRDSAARGFLPWTIVAGIAPRRLVYAHEFKWDQDRDPVWKRLQTVFGFYDHADFLSFTHGQGAVTGSSPTDTHCTHIGKTHRVRIHEAFRSWFGIDVTPESEFSARLPADRLRCWTPELKAELKPKSLSQMTTEVADRWAAENVAAQQKQSSHAEHQRDLRRRWAKLLGIDAAGPNLVHRNVRVDSAGSMSVWSVVLSRTSRDRAAVLLLRPKELRDKQPVVVAICSQGKARLLKERRDDIAALLERGAAVCLVDPIGIGESTLGDSHGRRSSATSISSTAQMLGRPLLGQQLQDVRVTLVWLRTEFKGRALMLWGESLTPPNPDTARFRQPRDDDSALPAPSEPQAPLLALLTGLFEDDVSTIYTVGCLSSWRSLLADYLVLTAHDSLVPGALTVGDLADLIDPDRSDRRVVLEAAVDGWNRLVQGSPQRTSPVKWLTN